MTADRFSAQLTHPRPERLRHDLQHFDDVRRGAEVGDVERAVRLEHETAGSLSRPCVSGRWLEREVGVGQARPPGVMTVHSGNVAVVKKMEQAIESIRRLEEGGR